MKELLSWIFGTSSTNMMGFIHSEAAAIVVIGKESLAVTQQQEET
ncbi:unnamed protein product [Linum tenue]|uniref:Uncharacterized protein n=1 Tax=Linum tenue TaxID=586396 RepID=A0AAV0IEF0_9ROSI|nr:unnamed protein product [Linum tenue]